MTYRNWWAESGHVAVKHDDCQRNCCNVCDGGLTICARCGGAEGSLTTHCPGEPVSFDRDQNVYDGKIDYYQGQWRLGRRTVFMYPEDYLKETP